MTISEELNLLEQSISDIKTEIIDKGQSVSPLDTLVSLPNKIDNISNIKGENYSKTPLNDIIEGTIEYLYDTSLDYIRPYCFTGCNNLRKVRFTNLVKICPHAFDKCFQLNTIILENNFVVLENVNSFKYTLIDKGLGRIYVKDSLINTYKTDSVWSYYSSYIYKISDLS